MNSKPGRRGWLVALTALALTLSACGDAEERSLCRQYDDLKAAVAQLEDLDPATATADEFRAIVEDVMVAAQAVQTTAEGLYDQSFSNLRFALVDLRQAAVDVGDEPLEVARPLLEDSWEASVTAYQLLKQRLDVVCGTD